MQSIFNPTRWNMDGNINIWKIKQPKTIKTKIYHCGTAPGNLVEWFKGTSICFLQNRFRIWERQNINSLLHCPFKHNINCHKHLWKGNDCNKSLWVACISWNLTFINLLTQNDSICCTTKGFERVCFLPG